MYTPCLTCSLDRVYFMFNMLTRSYISTGDIYSCHAVDNPDTSSEVEMLRKYGPDVPQHTLEKLVLAFGELRSMADQGLISYPYSTREVVNMVRHLQVTHLCYMYIFCSFSIF